MTWESVKPSPLQLHVFKVLYEGAHRSNSYSVREAAKELKVSVTTVREAIDELNDRFPVDRTLTREHEGKAVLVLRHKRVPHIRFHPLADRLYTEVVGLLRAYARVSNWSSRYSIRIGATNAILLHTLPDAVEEFVRIQRGRGEKVQLAFHEGDYREQIRAILNQEVDLAFGPPVAPVAGVLVESLERPLPCVCIFHKSHHFASRRKQIVSLDELSSEPLIALRYGLQPGLFEQISTDEDRGGERMEVVTFHALITYVAMGLGVGVIPFYKNELDAKKAQIRYAEIPELPKLDIAVYLPDGGEANLSEIGVRFLEITRKRAKAMSRIALQSMLEKRARKQSLR